MEKRLRVAAGSVGEGTHRIQASRKLSRRRRGVQHGAVALIDHFDGLVRMAHPPGGGVVVKGSLCYRTLDLEEEIRRQRGILVTPDRLHRAEVVEDHALATVGRRTPGADHLLGYLADGGSALQLARGNCLFDQRSDVVLVPCVRIGDLRRHADAPAGAQVDPVEEFLNRSRQAVAKWGMRAIPKRRLLCGATPSELFGCPPLLMGEVLLSRAPAQFIPVQVAIAGTICRADHYLIQSFLIGSDRLHQGHEVGRLPGNLHGKSLLMSLLQKLRSVDEELGRENKRTNLSRLYFVEYAVRASVAPHSARIRS